MPSQLAVSCLAVSALSNLATENLRVCEELAPPTRYYPKFDERSAHSIAVALKRHFADDLQIRRMKLRRFDLSGAGDPTSLRHITQESDPNLFCISCI